MYNTVNAVAPSNTAPILALLGERAGNNAVTAENAADAAEKLVDCLLGQASQPAVLAQVGNPAEKSTARFQQMLDTHDAIGLHLARIERALARLGQAIG